MVNKKEKEILDDVSKDIDEVVDDVDDIGEDTDVIRRRQIILFILDKVIMLLLFVVGWYLGSRV